MTAERMTGLSLELSSRCQLDCPLCVRHAISPEFPRLAMPAAVLDAVLPYLPPLEALDLTGWGEPLLHPQFPEFLARIRRAFAGRLSFTTNGLLFRRELIEAVVDQGVDVICFSLDAAAAETYARVRPGADFGRLLSNLRELIAFRRSRHVERPQLFALFLLRRDALEELPAFVRLAQALGLNGILFQQLTGVFTDAHLARITYTDYYPSDFDPARLEQSLAQARAEAKPGFVVAGPDRIHRSRLRGCGGFDMHQPFLSAQGEVSVCCSKAYPIALMRRSGQPRLTPPLSFGNVTREPLPLIWQKPEYRELRRQVLAGEFPEACADCIGLYVEPAASGQDLAEKG